jgi:hypothetical protein
LFADLFLSGRGKKMTKITLNFFLVAGLSLIVLAATTCGVAQAQVVSEVDSMNLGGGTTLQSIIVVREDGVNYYLNIDGLSGETLPAKNRTVIAVGAPASSSTPTGYTAVATMAAAFAVLGGMVTPAYASRIGAELDQVSITFVGSSVFPPITGGGSGQGTATHSDFAISKIFDVAPPSFFQQATGVGLQTLLAQFNLANPLAPAPSPACIGIATQLDVDSNGNLLVRVFQGNNVPFAGVTVIISVTSTAGTVQFQAVTDVNGLGQFNGPANSVALSAGTNITGISLQYPNSGVVSMCVVQGNTIPPVDISTTPTPKSVHSGNLYARLRKGTELGSQPANSFRQGHQ